MRLTDLKGRATGKVFVSSLFVGIDFLQIKHSHICAISRSKFTEHRDWPQTKFGFQSGSWEHSSRYKRYVEVFQAVPIYLPRGFGTHDCRDVCFLRCETGFNTWWRANKRNSSHTRFYHCDVHYVASGLSIFAEANYLNARKAEFLAVDCRSKYERSREQAWDKMFCGRNVEAGK